MKYKLTITTPIGVFYRYIETDISQSELFKNFQELTNMNYVSFDESENNESSIIFYEEVWKNSIVEINQIGEK
jgi:hypothetical protein